MSTQTDAAKDATQPAATDVTQPTATDMTPPAATAGVAQTAAGSPSPTPPPASDSLTRRILTFLAAAATFVVLTFVPAWTLRWPGGWLALGILLAGLLWQDAYVRRRNPGLMERRRRHRPETPWWDWALVIASQLCGFAIFVVAGLFGSRRYPGWVPLPLFLAGLVVWAVGQWIVAWAMATNLFFEGTIRLQGDVGHRVIDTGPYAFVRHPGYSGLLVYSVGLALLFGALPALVPAVLTAGWLLPRTLLEDRFLRAQLAGYAEYARRVQWRWVPGLW